ncbi:MAG: hypothetical protein KA343_13590 [Nitrosomonas sp.]|nr:hypothetical protein [Nitrosomonas sp.]MBP8086385.1 hypothetical protein [Saprospiraceae bacterium]
MSWLLFGIRFGFPSCLDGLVPMNITPLGDKTHIYCPLFCHYTTHDAKMNEKKDTVKPDIPNARVITLPSRKMPGHPDSTEKGLAALLNFNMLEDLDHLLDDHFSKPKG